MIKSESREQGGDWRDWRDWLADIPDDREYRLTGRLNGVLNFRIVIMPA